MLSIKDAILKAKGYAAEVFSADAVKDILLEEVDFRENPRVWLVTVSFLRSQATEGQSANSSISMAEILLGGKLRRQFKIFHIDGETGSLVRITSRETGLAA